MRTCLEFAFLHYFSGFEKPSAIQQRAIKPIVKRRDVIAQAQSGTGKTATFSIALLQSIDTTVRETQVLCLSPTRELAVQIQKVRYHQNCSQHTFGGFQKYGNDYRKTANFIHRPTRTRLNTHSVPRCRKLLFQMQC